MKQEAKSVTLFSRQMWGAFNVLMLLVMCMFPANFLGDYSTSVEVSQISGQLNLRFASNPFAASQLLSL